MVATTQPFSKASTTTPQANVGGSFSGDHIRDNGKSSDGQTQGISRKGRMFMTVLALQYGMQPLLQKACVDRHLVDRISLMLVADVTKILLCVVVIASSGPKVYRPMLESWTLRGSLETAALPAATYTLQNWLMQIAYVNLDSLTFNLLNQTKTLFAALSLYIVMGKKQTFPQLVALSLLLGAALLLNISSKNDGNSEAGGGNLAAPEEVAHARLWLGVLPVLGGAILSGMGAAITQRTLQQSGRNASQLSLELAVYGVAILLVTSGLGLGGGRLADAGNMWRDGMFRGWTPWTVLPVLSLAAGGLIVGQVTKHAGSVQKGFALIGGIIVTATVQSTLEKSALTMTHWIAAALVAGGTFLHSRFPYRPPKEAEKKSI